jgi:hypothetical protein
VNGATMIDVLSSTDISNFVAAGLCGAVMACAVVWMNKRGLKRGSTAEDDVMFYPLPAVGRRFADNFGATLQHLGVVSIVPQFTSARFGQPILLSYRAELVSRTGAVSFFGLLDRELVHSPVALRLENVSGEWMASAVEAPPRGKDRTANSSTAYLDRHYDFACVLIRELKATVQRSLEAQRVWQPYIDDGEPMKVQ